MPPLNPILKIDIPISPSRNVLLETETKIDLPPLNKIDIPISSSRNVLLVTETKIDLPPLNISPSKNVLLANETKSIRKQQNFTGNKDTDFIIIDQLDDESLLSLCQTNKYLANICNDEKFWEKRFKLKNDLYHIKIKPSDISWKNYYIEVLANKNNIYINSRKNGRQLYIGESPVIPEDSLIYSHVEKPKRLSKVFYAIINKKGELLSKLYTNAAEIKKFYKDNFLKEYGALGNKLLLTGINEKWVVENIYK